ncbi:MAG: peptidylprolyl isomerase [Bdellovibrionales bacterium]
MPFRRNQLLFLVSLAFGASVASAKIIERIITVVNDRVILQSDVDSFRKKLTGEGLVDDALLQLVDRKILVKDRQALINYLIDEAVIDSEVKKRGLDITFERVEQEIRNILRSRQLTRAQLREVLAQKGTSMSDYQAFIKTSIERQSLIEREVSSRIKISDEDVAAHYANVKGVKSNQAYEYSLAHILFLPSNGGEKAARERATQVKKKLKDNLPFEKLAEQNSEDPNFSQGGLLGNFKSGEMLKEIEEGVRGLNVGDISNPIKTRMGIHLVKVLKKTVTSDPELDSKKEQIRGQLFAEAFKRQFRSWLNQRRDEAFVRINDVADAKAK